MRASWYCSFLWKWVFNSLYENAQFHEILYEIPQILPQPPFVVSPPKKIDVYRTISDVKNVTVGWRMRKIIKLNLCKSYLLHTKKHTRCNNNTIAYVCREHVFTPTYHSTHRRDTFKLRVRVNNLREIERIDNFTGISMPWAIWNSSHKREHIINCI